MAMQSDGRLMYNVFSSINHRFPFSLQFFYWFINYLSGEFKSRIDGVGNSDQTFTGFA
jgi:hypothetical protein